jgi:chromodomain-helicase-DNA-binding protein 4
MQKGKQKLVLDHLIVQKMDDDEPGGNDLQSILTYGAKALFDEEGEEKEDRGIHCTRHLHLSFQDLTYRADSEADVKNLIERTEQATDEEAEAEGKTGDFSFSFAKVWTAEKEELDELPAEDEATPGAADDADSFAAVLAQLEVEKAKAKAAEATGRGARRRAARTVTVSSARSSLGRVRG